MSRALTLLPLLLALSARAWEPDPVRAADVAVLVPALALIAADFSTSLDIKNHGQHCEIDKSFTRLCYAAHEEQGLVVRAVFGKHPTDAQFMVWGLGYMATTTAVWYVLPERFRWLVPLAVGAYEAAILKGNVNAGLRMRLPALSF